MTIAGCRADRFRQMLLGTAKIWKIQPALAAVTQNGEGRVY